MNDLPRLASLLHERNQIDEQISGLINRPATQGHIGEFISSQVFGIRLMESASNKAIDGYFTIGLLAGKSVDIKFYGKQEGLLAINEGEQPDYFLVLTGPVSPALSSKGQQRLCVVDHVYIFDGKALASELLRRGVKFGVATSVKKDQWEAAEIYPIQRNKTIILADDQKKLLGLFSSKAGD